jgi:hypothetical protein
MGLYVPVTGLAGIGLDGLSARFSEGVGRRVAVLALVLALPTTFLVLVIGFFGMLTHDPALYLTRSEDQALIWLANNSPADALVLAAPETGLLIPAHTGRRVLYGHPYETVDAEKEKAQVVDFFQGNLSSPSALLDQRGVDFIFYGPRERRLGALPEEIGIRQVYSSGVPDEDQVIIYQVMGLN